MTEYPRPVVLALAYGTTVTPDMGVGAPEGQTFTLTVTDQVAYTLANPLNLRAGQTLTLIILNSGGGAMGAVTPGSAYHTAGAMALPANTKRQVYRFFALDAVTLIELSRSAADIT